MAVPATPASPVRLGAVEAGVWDPRSIDVLWTPGPTSRMRVDPPGNGQDDPPTAPRDRVAELETSPIALAAHPLSSDVGRTSAHDRTHRVVVELGPASHRLRSTTFCQGRKVEPMDAAIIWILGIFGLLAVAVWSLKGFLDQLPDLFESFRKARVALRKARGRAVAETTEPNGAGAVHGEWHPPSARAVGPPGGQEAGGEGTHSIPTGDVP